MKNHAEIGIFGGSGFYSLLENGREVNKALAAKARQAGKDCELVFVPGDHQAMVAPAVKLKLPGFVSGLPAVSVIWAL